MESKIINITSNSAKGLAQLTINQQDRLASEFQSHRIQLATYIFLPVETEQLITYSTRHGCWVPHLLSWHDESSANISVLDEPFAVGKRQSLSEVQSSHSRSIGNLWRIETRTIGLNQLTGITTSTSIFFSANTRRTSSAKRSPIAIRLRYTEIPSKTESGRAK